MASLRTLAKQRRQLSIQVQDADMDLSEYLGVCEGPECSTCGGADWKLYGDIIQRAEQSKAQALAKLAKLGLTLDPHPYKVCKRAFMRKRAR